MPAIVAPAIAMPQQQQQQQQQQYVDPSPTALNIATSAQGLKPSQCTSTVSLCSKQKDGLFYFPQKLHEMLEDAEREGFADVVSWSDNGFTFWIHQRMEIGPFIKRYFRQTKFQSFLRQLQSYGFTWGQKQWNRNLCSHPLFIRGKQFLCTQMKRRRLVITEEKRKKKTKTMMKGIVTSNTNNTIDNYKTIANTNNDDEEDDGDKIANDYASLRQDYVTKQEDVVITDADDTTATQSSTGTSTGNTSTSTMVESTTKIGYYPNEGNVSASNHSRILMTISTHPDSGVSSINIHSGNCCHQQSNNNNQDNNIMPPVYNYYHHHHNARLPTGTSSSLCDREIRVFMMENNLSSLSIEETAYPILQDHQEHAHHQ